MTDRFGLWKALGEVFVVFAFSRILVALLIVSVSLLAFETVPAREGMNAHAHLQTPMIGVKARLAQVLSSADANWYLGIARHGYTVPAHEHDLRVPQNWVFFPLFPALIAVLSTLTGSILWSGVFIANAAFLVGLTALALLAREMGLDSHTRFRWIVLTALFPTGYFFSAAMTESLFFALVTAWMLLLRQGRLGWAAAALGLATATRPTGILLLPAMIWGLHERGGLWSVKTAGLLLLSAAGAIGFSVFLWHVCGDPFAFINHQRVWGRGADSPLSGIAALATEIRAGLLPWNFVWLHVITSGVAACAVVHFFRRRQYLECLVLLVPIVACLQTGTFLSLTRIVSVLVPLQLFIAEWANTPRRELVAFGISIALLTLLTAGYAGFITQAMT